VKIEATGEGDDRVEAGHALATLEQADLGPVQAGELGEKFLGEPGALAHCLEVVTELLTETVHAPETCPAADKSLRTIVCRTFQLPSERPY
jgi:hypothetical protein